MVQRSFMNFNKVIFQSLFVSVVKPLVSYGTSAWNPIQQYLIKNTENVQRRASKQRLTYRESLNVFDLPKLQYRRYRD